MRQVEKKRPKEDALPYAVKLLASRSYSTRKLKDKLKLKGYEAEEIELAIEKLKARNLLDDARFAEGFVRTRIETHPRGKSALIRDLVSRGISGATAKQAVSDHLSADQELDLAKELLRRKSRQYSSLDPETRKRRLTALLARRGFRPGIIFKVIDLPPDDSNQEDSY
ncbi:MAG: RecX family transcriptional regulator [Calditrichaeota bacterium]|nr:RecX family transcriptional regulator [Calditrichota bacterium]